MGWKRTHRYLSQQRTITNQLAKFVQEAGFTPEECAKFIGVMPITLNRWIAGGSLPLATRNARIEELLHVRDPNVKPTTPVQDLDKRRELEQPSDLAPGHIPTNKDKVRYAKPRKTAYPIGKGTYLFKDKDQNMVLGGPSITAARRASLLSAIFLQAHSMTFEEFLVEAGKLLND